MDTLNHGVAGYLIFKTVGLPEPVSIVHGVISMMPDIIGFIEKIYYWDSQRWNWYSKVHQLKWMRVIFGWGLHIFLDKYTHGEGKRWWKWNERLWVEVLSWLVLIIFWIFIR